MEFEYSKSNLSPNSHRYKKLIGYPSRKEGKVIYFSLLDIPIRQPKVTNFTWQIPQEIMIREEPARVWGKPAKHQFSNRAEPASLSELSKWSSK